MGAVKLWVKLNGYQPIKVSTKGCTDLYDFAKKIKQELDTRSQIDLFTSLDKEPLKSWLSIKDLLSTHEFMTNSGENPLIAKALPAVPGAILKKKIYIAQTDDDGDFTGEYRLYVINDNDDLREYIKNYEGLIHLSSPDEILRNFVDIKDGEKYFRFRHSENFYSWQKHEADAMEAKTR